MVGLDDYVYILGGTTSKRTNAIERYCMDLHTWEKCEWRMDKKLTSLKTNPIIISFE